MDNELLDLFKSKEKMFLKMLEYAQKVKFEYTEDEAELFSNYVRNLSVHIGAIEKNQAEINKYNKSEYETDKEVCEIEKRCQALARQIYNIDKEVNDNMKKICNGIKEKYISSKNQQKIMNYNNNISCISETFASFDTKQ